MKELKKQVLNATLKNELVKVFQNDKFGNIRVVLISGKEHFCASDVAKALGYTNASKAVNDHCRYLTKRYIPHPQNENKELQVTFIPEGDLYRLIAHSKLPSAEQFESWVFDEVLPSIRQHGAYMTEDTLEKALTSPDFLIKLATNLKEEQEARRKAELKIEQDKPKVIFADAVSASKTSILIGELAKILKQNGVNTGEKRLFEQLRNDGYLIKRKGTDYNSPTQKAMELGLFEVKETCITHADGHTTVNKTTKVTGRGQQYFINKFLNE